MVPQAAPGVPGPVHHELRRERLLEVLHQHATRPLVLLLAPAGFGKSTVAAAYARESGACMAWLTLHPGDRDARFLFGRLAGVLESAFGDPELLPSLRRGLDEGAEAPGLARLLVTDLAAAPAGFILVLDDYHTLQDTEDIHAAVDMLVRGLPEPGQVVITAREPPPLSIQGLVAHDAVFVLGADDLRFTPDETAELRRRRGGDPSHDGEADGWVAGILLGGAPRQLGTTDNGSSLLDSYVEREVLGRLRPAQRRWLETLAVLESITPVAAERLLGPGPWPSRLALLAETCPFLVGGERGSFRLHALVRDALLSRLRRASPRRARAAWQAARALAEEAFDVASAVRACQELGRVKDAVQLIHRTVEEATRAGRWPAALAALDLLPLDTYGGHPRLLLAMAHALVQTGRPDAARQVAELALTRGGRTGHVGLQVAAIVELANIARHSGDLNAAEDWLSAAGYLLRTSELPPREQRALEGRLVGVRGVCLAIRGKVGPAREALEAAERLLSLNGASRELAVVQYNLGTFCIRAGEYAAGRTALAASSRHWRAVGDRVMLAMTQLLLGNLHLRLGELEQAGAVLARVVEAARAAGASRIESYGSAALGAWHRANGRVADAATSFDISLRMAEEVGERELLVRVLRQRAEVALLQQDAPAARELLARAQSEGQQLGNNVELPAVERALGRLHLVAGADQLALRHLEAALQVASPEWEPDERAITLYWLGTAHLALGHAHEAEAALVSAVHLVQASVGLPILAGPAAEDGRLLRYGLEAGVSPSELSELDRLAAMRRPWTGVRPAMLEVVARQELPRLEARLFGPLVVCRDGRVIEELATRDRARELFALLLLHPDGLPAREITELLWPDQAPERAQHNLRSTAYLLRGFLGGKAAVRHARLAYRLAPRLELWTDAQAFDAALRVARQASGSAAQAALQHAVDLYRGPLLADSGWEWVEPLRATYQARAAAAGLRLCSALGSLNPERSDVVAEWTLQLDPVCEAAYEQLLRNALARQDGAAARAVTHRYQDMAAQYGLRPNPGLLRAI